VPLLLSVAFIHPLGRSASAVPSDGSHRSAAAAAAAVAAAATDAVAADAAAADDGGIVDIFSSAHTWGYGGSAWLMTTPSPHARYEDGGGDAVQVLSAQATVRKGI
jgi:hypothetical protein